METIHHYIIRDEIGEGGMSKVYRAYDPMREREVAIKLMSEELSRHEKARERFIQEAQMVLAMAHPAIVPVWDHGEVDGRLYIVMPYMSGGSLWQQIASRPLPLAQCVAIIQRIANALDAAHAENIIHRDVKPHNILLDDTGQAYLADFGIARLMGEDGEGKTITMVGTPEFIAPEQAMDGKLTTQADVYQLGVTAFCMLTGQQPFTGSSFKLIAQHMSQPVPSAEALNPLLPAGTDAVLRQAMAKSPIDRHVTAGAFATALANLNTTDGTTPIYVLPEAWLQSEVPPLSAQDAAPEEPSIVVDTTSISRWRRRLAAATAVLILTIGTLFTLNRGVDTPSLPPQIEASTIQTLVEDAIPQVEVILDAVEEVLREETAVTQINNNDNGDGNNNNNNPPPNNGGNNRRGNYPNSGNGGNGNGRPPRNGNPPPPPPPAN